MERIAEKLTIETKPKRKKQNDESKELKKLYSKLEELDPIDNEADYKKVMDNIERINKMMPKKDHITKDKIFESACTLFGIAGILTYENTGMGNMIHTSALRVVDSVKRVF